jgi:hypothetical protein
MSALALLVSEVSVVQRVSCPDGDFDTSFVNQAGEGSQEFAGDVSNEEYCLDVALLCFVLWRLPGDGDERAPRFTVCTREFRVSPPKISNARSTSWTTLSTAVAV